MLNNQKAEFTALLATAMAVYGKTITTGMADLYFAALQQHDLAIVREAMNMHLQDPAAGQYQPKPADIIRNIQASSHDGRPEGDEAWSMAVTASDESVTAVLTDEIQGALWVARPLLDMGDKVAARKAFLDAYERLVRVSRQQGKPAKWHVSLGQDPAGRAFAIENAVQLGRIGKDQADQHLARIGCDTAPASADGQAIAGLITGGPVPKAVSDDVRAKLATLRASLTRTTDATKEAVRKFEREERAKLNAKADELLGIKDK